MMRIIYVDDKRGLQRRIDDFVIMGYSVKTHMDTFAVVKKQSYGNFWAHILLFLLTFGIGNVIYFIYCYSKSEEFMIKIDTLSY